MTGAKLAFGEHGERVETVEFDFDALDADVAASRPSAANGEASGSLPSAAPPDNCLTPHEIEMALKLFETLLKWVWQSGMKNPDGVKIRAIICCWIFLKPLRPLTLTQLAQHYGMDKQSFGRWVDDFKLRFPHIRTVHMRNLERP